MDTWNCFHFLLTSAQHVYAERMNFNILKKFNVVSLDWLNIKVTSSEFKISIRPRQKLRSHSAGCTRHKKGKLAIKNAKKATYKVLEYILVFSSYFPSTFDLLALPLEQDQFTIGNSFLEKKCILFSFLRSCASRWNGK